jgi:anti-repressor protein
MLGFVGALQAKVAEQDNQIADMRPKVEALELITEAHGSHCRTNAAKILQVKPLELVRWLRTNGWTYRRLGDHDDIAYQSKITAGYLEHKLTTGERSEPGPFA